MLSPIEMGAMATAGIGGVTMVWGNIKGIFNRVESLIIVKAHLKGGMYVDFMDYCWATFKFSRFGNRTFESGDYFIRPKNRLGRVATEDRGKSMTFWKGYRPLFVSQEEKGGLSVSFIRGMFNLEEEMIKAVNLYDAHKHERTDKSSRYYVERCFGKKSRQDKNSGDNAEAPLSLASKQESAAGFRPLFYKKDDLGFPTSKNPMDNLAYNANVQEFYQEVSRWKEEKEWFQSKGLPWRLGAGLFGPPGTGKSSLARAIGQGLDMPIHSYDLTTMDNEELVNHWQNSLSSSPCIVLLEDIDRIFDEKKQIKTANDKAPLTLDCLLNCISGVQPSDGILVLVTANDVTKLDPALGVPDPTGKSTRPGRLDRAVYVGTLNREGREKIASRILSDVPNLIEETVDQGDGETGAQFESRCSKLALEQRWGKFKVYGSQNADISKTVLAEFSEDEKFNSNLVDETQSDQ